MANLFEDSEFFGPTALYIDPNRPIYGGIPAKHVKWKRPSELAKRPSLFIDSVESGDVIQGTLGDCWFLGALSVVATNPNLLQHIFITNKYNPEGKYTLQFYKEGAWVEVTVDDRLPCEPTGALLNASCADSNEFWVAIAEKAYAKLHGSYEGIVGGISDYALRDLTGGVAHTFEFGTAEVKADIESGQLWTNMLEWKAKGSLMGCSFMGDGAAEEEVGQGVLRNHAYGLLDVQAVGRNRLIKIRNPWGITEWTGPWSDNSSEWTPQLKEQLKHTSQDDGTFWMDFSDFVRYFNQLNVCFLFPDEWEGARVEGEWVGESAGGCSNFKTWCKNPQYTLSLKEETEVHIVLSQPDARMRPGPKFNTYDAYIGFVVVRDNDNKGAVSRLLSNELAGRSGQYKSARSVQLSQTFAKGTYLIIPSCYHQECETTFTIDVITDKAIELEDGAQIPDSAMPDIDPLNDPDTVDAVEAVDETPAPEEHVVTSVDKLVDMVATLTERLDRLEAEVASMKAPKLNARPWLTANVNSR